MMTAQHKQPERPHLPPAPLSREAPGEGASVPPHAPSPIPLLADYLAAELPIIQLCEFHDITPDQLTAWLERPDTQRTLAALERAAAQRERIVAAEARVAATARLRDLAAFPADYATNASSISPRAAETARKAAAQLLRTKPPAPRSPAPAQPAPPTPAPRRTHRPRPPRPPRLAKPTTPPAAARTTAPPERDSVHEPHPAARYHAQPMISRITRFLGVFLLFATLVGCAGPAAPRHRIGSLPFPGPNTIYTLADPDRLGEHRYGIALGKPLSDAAETQRGTIYTCQAGFLDVAHLRLTVDWMRHAREQLEPAIRAAEPHASFVGPDDDIIHATITYPPVWDDIPDDARERALNESLVRAAARASYLIWTWHELITHEGHSTFALISEEGSAFGYDDMVSHAVGANIGRAVLNDDRPHNDAATAHLALELDRLGVVSKGACALAVDAVQGVWWERSGPILREYNTGLRSGTIPVHRAPGVPGCPSDEPTTIETPFAEPDPTIQPRVVLSIEPRTRTGRRIAEDLGADRLSVENIDDAIAAIAHRDATALASDPPGD